MELDNVLVPIIANRERGALVAVHRPSFVEDVKTVTICTYEEIQELMSNQQELSVPLVVIQPKKFFLSKMILCAHPGYSNFTVYLTLPEKLSEFEVCIRVRDLFENGIFAVECVEKLDCVYCDPADERSLSLFAIRIDVNKKLDSFGLVIKPLHGITDLILPKQDVVDSRLMERIQIPQVYQINSMKRNGCFRFNEQEDMVCMRVLSQTGTLEEQKSILQELHQTMNSDSTPVIEEFQLRSSFPWLDDEFIQMNGNTVSIAVVDLRTFESEHVVEILHILRELEIFYYLVGGKRMVIYGDGEKLVKLRMNLLPMDVHIPIGQKQGAFQVNMRKSCVNRNDTLQFEVTVTKIGAFTTIPVQIPTGDIQEMITQDNLSNCEVCKFLAGKYSAENFALQWTESSGNDVLCLCFEIPQEYECQLPICIDSDKQLTQIVARGPNVRSIQAGLVSKKSETKIEHWQGVVRKKLSDDSVRKNQLAFERQRPSSATRFYALRTLQIEEGLCKTTCVVGNEEAPFFFTDTVRVGDLRSFLEVKEELLLHWRDRSLFEDSLASTVCFSDKDEQHKMKLKNCIVQVRLFATNLYRIAKPTFRNGRWIVLHADYLTVRPFSDCYITMVCPPGIHVEQVVYGEKGAESPHIVAAISFISAQTGTSSERSRGKNDSFFQQTKRCFGDITATTQLDDDSGVDDPQGENFSSENVNQGDDTPCPKLRHMSTPLPVDKDSQGAIQATHKKVHQNETVHQFQNAGNASNDITDVGGIASDKKRDLADTRDEAVDVCMNTDPEPSTTLVLNSEHSVPNCQQNQINGDQSLNQTDAAEHTTGVSSPMKELHDDGRKNNDPRKPDHDNDPIEEATPNEEQTKFTNKIVSTPKSKTRSREKGKEKPKDPKSHLATLFRQNALFAKTTPPPIQENTNDDQDLELVGVKHVDAPKSTGDTVSLACQQILAKNAKAVQYIKDCSNVISNWSFLFGIGDFQVLISRAACYAMSFQATMCYAITALRILTFAPWTDAHMKGHLREVALCAIAKGWTHATQNVIVGRKRITIAEISIAISSYENEKVFPPCAVSDLDQTILEVSSDLYEDHITEFFPGFNFECFSCCNTIRKHISVFDAEAFDWTDIKNVSLARICAHIIPRTAFEDDQHFHKSDCCDNNNIHYKQNTHGAFFTVLFKQEMASFPLIEDCTALINQSVTIDFVRDTQNSSDVSVPNTAEKDFQCKALIAVKFGATAESNHFFLIEETAPGKIKTFDNLIGYTWKDMPVKTANIRIYGLVMCAKSSSKYDFDPPLYKDLAKILTQSQPESKMKKKKHLPCQNGKPKFKGSEKLGIQLSSYNHGFSKLRKERKINSSLHNNLKKNDGRVHPKSDEALLKSTSPNVADKRTCDDNVLTEPSTKRLKGDVEMIREQPAKLGVISLFDGVSSVLSTITELLGVQPNFFIAAECDQVLRHLVAEKHGFRLDGKWSRHPSGMISIYIDDVKKLFSCKCKLLSEMISIAGPERKWLVVAGSPCQDLTLAGSYKGLLGLCGQQSSLFFYVHLCIWIIQSNYPKGYVRFLVENAGSMQEMHKKAIKNILGLTDMKDSDLKWDTSKYFGIRRERFFFRNYLVTGRVDNDGHQTHGRDYFGPLLDVAGKPLTIGPLLRVRQDVGGGVLRLSWTAYQPIALLWDHMFWGGFLQFSKEANLQGNGKLPNFDFTRCLPPKWYDAWHEFLQNMHNYSISGTDKDAMVWRLLPIFSNPNAKIPFRTLNSHEVQKFAGLLGHFTTVKTNTALLTEHTIRDYCGNSFHPALIKAALGQKQDVLEWLSSLSDLPCDNEVADPQEARQIFHQLADEVKIAAMTSGKIDFAKQTVGINPMPDVDLAQLPQLSFTQTSDIQTQNVFTPGAPKKVVESLYKLKSLCGPLSDAAKRILHQVQCPIDITEQLHFGSGIYEFDSIIEFFYGKHKSNWRRRVSSDAVNKTARQIALLKQNYQHLRSLLIEVMHAIVGIGLKMQIIHVVDLQERTTVHTIGVDDPQWLVYCFIDPIRNFFYCDTAAWNAYGPLEQYKFSPNIIKLQTKEMNLSYSFLLPFFHSNGSKPLCLFSGKGTVLLAHECPYCMHAWDTDSLCSFHTAGITATKSHRAIAAMDERGNFSIIQFEKAAGDVAQPIWRVLVVPCAFLAMLSQPLDDGFQHADPPISFNSKVQDIQADIYPALTRMNTFEQAWSVFNQGYDNYVDEHCDLVVAHFWGLQDQQQ